MAISEEQLTVIAPNPKERSNNVSNANQLLTGDTKTYNVDIDIAVIKINYIHW